LSDRVRRFVAAAAALLAVSVVAVGQGRPPNIVVIVADDMGYADLGVQGGKDIPTPNIDALAAGGTRFTDAYVSGPYCSPTRAGLMTGRYPQRFGHEFNIAGQAMHGDVGLPLTETTLADRLRAAGYRTAVFGKWHLGWAPRFHPLERGFDEFFGFLGGAHTYLDPTGVGSNPVMDGHTPVTTMPYLTDAIADHAVRFIERQGTHPFLLYVAFNAVHLPLQATDRYLARFSQIADPRRRAYAAMLSAMDDAVGRTVAALRAANLEENTLIFFFSDNGGPTIVGGINGSSNAPLRGSKRQTYEGGIRVPFIVRWKGHLPEGRTDARPIIQLDVMPTALAAAGVPVRPEWKLDGVNLLPFLTGQNSGAPHDALYWRLGAIMAIREGDWKLVKMDEGPLVEDVTLLNDLSGAALYNLREDIGETRDQAAAHPDKVRELGAAWQRWASELVKPRWPPSPVPGPF
jgi:arylsulfatase A-like enzyme